MTTQTTTQPLERRNYDVGQRVLDNITDTPGTEWIVASPENPARLVIISPKLLPCIVISRAYNCSQLSNVPTPQLLSQIPIREHDPEFVSYKNILAGATA